MITLKQSEYQKLINRISKLEKMFTQLMRKLQKEPQYGSSEWWDREFTLAEKELSSDEGKIFESGEELVNYLETLPNAS